jgi:hypothetical protein
MKRLFWLGLSAMVGISLAAAARGQEYQLASTSANTYDSRLSSLEAKFTAMEGKCGESCQEGCSCNCCRDSGWIGGFEMTFLRPHASMGTKGYDGTPLRFDFEAAPRLWTGYQGANGLGFRFRYWDFDHTQTVASLSTAPRRLDNERYNISVSDLEVTMLQGIGCNWELTLAGGVRYVDFEESQFSRPATGAVDRSHAFASSTWGPTIAAEVRRPIIGYVSLFGNVRGSALYGNQNEFFNGALYRNMEGNVKFISEMQLGVDYRKPLRNACGEWFARAAVEGQYWSTFSGEPSFDGSGAVGFVGMALSVGIAR